MTRTSTLTEQIVDYVYELSHAHHISKIELFHQASAAIKRELNRLEASDPDRNK